MHFKNEGQKRKTGPIWGGFQWKGEGKRRMKEGEYSLGALYACMKIEK
jgi:hypothetical protein